MAEEQTRKRKAWAQRIAERRRRIRRWMTVFVSEERRLGKERRSDPDRRAIGHSARPWQEP